MTNNWHSTTYKVEPNIGNGIRIMAAVNGDSVAVLTQQAVERILSHHHRKIGKTPARTDRGGRPHATIQQAASAVMRSKPTRNEALPTRIHPTSAQELAKLAEELGTQMNHLAEEGAKQLLNEGPEIARAVARMAGDAAYEQALDAIQNVLKGEMSEEDFRSFKVIGANAGARAALQGRRRKA